VKFGETRKSIVGTAGRAKIRGNPGIRAKAGPEDRKAGATRSLDRRERGGCEIRGNLEIHKPTRRGSEDSGKPGNSPSAKPEDVGLGETRSLIDRRNWKSEEPGKPGDLPDGTAEGYETRGNSKIDRRQSWKMQKPGKPGDSSRGETGKRKEGATWKFAGR